MSESFDSSKKNIILVGGGGHCTSCIDVIEATREFNIVGIVEKKGKTGGDLLGYKIFASDEELPILIARYPYYLITVGHVGISNPRKALYENIRMLGGRFPHIVSPYAYVSRHARIGDGTIVHHKAVINARADIGENVIINTAAVIEHDVVVGSHSHVSTASIINGCCRLGQGVFIGSRSVLFHGVSVPSNTVIGSGTIVTKNLDRPGTYYGQPARLIRGNTDE